MANLSNINNKFLVTTGGNVLIGQTSAIGSSIFQVTGASTFTGNILMGNTVTNPASGFADQTGIGLKYSTTVPTIEVSSDSAAMQLGRSSTGGEGQILGLRKAGAIIHNFDTNNVSIGTNATFAGNVNAKLSNIAGLQNKFNIENATNTSVLASFGLNLSNDQLILGSDYAASFLLKTGGTTALTIDTSQNSTFANRVSALESFNSVKDGADTVADGPFFALKNAGGTRQYLWQLDASNNIDYWYYNGSTWTQTISLLNNGGATFAGNVKVNLVSSAAGAIAAFDSSGNTIWLTGRSSDGESSVSFRNNADSAYNGRIAATDTLMSFSQASDYTFDGNVGIGTDSPSTYAKLNVVSSTQYNGIVFGNGTYNVGWISGTSATNDNGQLSLSSAGVQKVQINSDSNSYFNGGNVGIGTDSPDLTGFGWNCLSVVGGTTAGSAGVLELGSPTTNANNQNLGIIAFMDGSTRNAQIGVQRATSTSTSNMSFYTNAGSGIEERMRITSGGNILVGGSNDYSRISVTNGNSTRTGITLSDGNTASLMLFAGNNSDAVIAIDTQNLSFKTGATAGQDNGTERMRILNNGNISIPNGSIEMNPSGGQGIYLGSNNGSNLLDDYEEGTWTPTISHNNGTGAIPLTITGGARYVKVGKLVYVNAYLTAVNPTGASGGSGAYYAIRSLPFTADAYGTWDVVYANTNMNSYGGYSAGDNLYFMHNGTNGQRSAAHVNGAQFNAFGANAFFMFQAVYTTP